MTEQSQLNHESSAVQKHLEIMQGAITRMAENSRYCKVWCVTLVAATLVLVARTGDAMHTLIAIVPIVLFLVLDAYYLALERGFRESYNSFVSGLARNETTVADLYKVGPKGSILRHFVSTLLGSFAILPFYALLAATVVVAWLLIL